MRLLLPALMPQEWIISCIVHAWTYNSSNSYCLLDCIYLILISSWLITGEASRSLLKYGGGIGPPLLLLLCNVTAICRKFPYMFAVFQDLLHVIQHLTVLFLKCWHEC